MDKKVEEKGFAEHEENEEISTSRRKFVQAASKVAVYTPPAMMLLMNPSMSAFARSSGVTEVCDPETERRRRRNNNNNNNNSDGS